MEKQQIGKLLKLISDKIRVNADAAHKKHGLTFSQVQVLGFLHRNKGRATQKEIEKYLEVSHPAVVKLVARLADAGFIECFPDEEDRRNKIVCTTFKSEELKYQIHQEQLKAETQLTEGMSEPEIEELRRLLNILLHNCEKNSGL